MFRVRVSGFELLQALRAKGGRVIEVLMTRSNALMLQLQSKIVSEKLSGQVLARRTGMLSASVNAIPASLDMDNLKIRFGVESSGGPAWYGRLFEEGGSDHAYKIMATKARALAFLNHGKQVYAKAVMHPPQQQRAFMRPSVEEFMPVIQAELNEAVHDVLKE